MNPSLLLLLYKSSINNAKLTNVVFAVFQSTSFAALNPQTAYLGFVFELHFGTSVPQTHEEPLFQSPGSVRDLKIATYEDAVLDTTSGSTTLCSKLTP